MTLVGSLPVHFFADFCNTNGIEHIKTAPYHPQSNGQAVVPEKLKRRDVVSHAVQALTEFVMRPMLGDRMRESTIDALWDKEIALFSPDRLRQRTYRLVRV